MDTAGEFSASLRKLPQTPFFGRFTWLVIIYSMSIALKMSRMNGSNGLGG